MTPPHSAGIYYLFGFFLFGIFFASSGSRRRPLPCRLPFNARHSRFILSLDNHKMTFAKLQKVCKSV